MNKENLLAYLQERAEFEGPYAPPPTAEELALMPPELAKLVLQKQLRDGGSTRPAYYLPPAHAQFRNYRMAQELSPVGPAPRPWNEILKKGFEK